MRAFVVSSVRTRLVLAISLLVVSIIAVVSYAMISAARRSLSLVGTQVAEHVDIVRVHQKDTIQHLVDDQVAMAKAGIEERARTLATVVSNVAAVPLLTFDVGQLNRQCEAACRDPDVLLCIVQDKNGETRSTYINPNHPRICARLADNPEQSPAALHAEFAKSPDVIAVEASITLENQSIGQVVIVATIDSAIRQSAAIRADAFDLLKKVDGLAASISREIGEQKDEHSRDAVWRMIFVSGAALGLGVFRALAIAIKITKPLKQTMKVLEAVNQGDFQQRVKVNGRDEVTMVADSVNRLAETLQSKRDLESSLEASCQQLSQTNEELSREVQVRLQAEKQLEQMHRELMTAARRAGMAEIATGVLHNVGNVLNSVNVSASLVLEQVRKSKINQLSRVCRLLEEHGDDLETFFAEDAKGKQIPGFLKMLSELLAREQSNILEEIESISSNVEHIKTIVSTQQSYAGMSGMIEPVDLRAMLETAVKLNASSFMRHDILVERDYAELPELLIDKQKVLQAVINLMGNAKDAVLDCAPERRRIFLTTEQVNAHRVRICVRDTGVGISPENLTRIFSYGFTTKKTGHGFGLHTCANAAQEMGGSLSVTSEGLDHGATFSLELPFQAAGVSESLSAASAAHAEHLAETSA